jgi:hypothetical protein
MSRSSLAVCAALACVWLTCCGFVQRPLTPEEAKIAAHYTNNDPAWGVLAHATVTVDRAKGQLSADFGPEVKALAGKSFEVSGFITPLETDTQTRHFIVTRRSTTCPFCAPNEPTEAVEVQLTDRTPFTSEEVAVRGRLVLTRSSDEGLFYTLVDATRVTDED